MVEGLIEKFIEHGKGRQCVLLLSGGLDSTTLLGALTLRKWKVNALTIYYGQKHKFEIQSAKKNAQIFGCLRHKIVKIPIAEIARSALTTPQINVPTRSKKGRIPATYVPARNLIFLSIAVAWAESLKIKDIFIATSSVDYSGYPDCRKNFIEAFENAVNLGTKAGVMSLPFFKIHAPLSDLSKKETILMGLEAGVDYSITHTCYSPYKGRIACGKCDSCKLRIKGFKEAGLIDPVSYRNRVIL